jgi:hypothetical protein
VYILNSDGLPLSLETNSANRINFRASVQTMEEEEDPEPKPDICFKIKVAEFYPQKYSNYSTIHV